MGVAEMQREIEKRVVGLFNKISSSELKDEMKTEIEPNQEELQNMIEEALREVHSKRPKP
jgi:chemotaxis protein CheY-P-specific phosphatase CheC